MPHLPIPNLFGYRQVRQIILKTCLYKKLEICWSDYNIITQYAYELGMQPPIGYDVHYSDEMKILMEFMSKEYRIYGKCPNCNKTLSMSVLSYKPLEKDLLTKPAWSYSDNDWEGENLTDYKMKELLENICKSHKYIDKYFSCPICQEIFRSSFTLLFKDDKLFLIKIGQYCSLRDFNENYTNRFVKDLKSKELRKEYEEALITHDEGHSIAAYVYMRRVIEKLILQKFNEKERDKNIDDFKQLHFDEKIQYLKSDLPELLQDKKYMIYPALEYIPLPKMSVSSTFLF